MAQWVSAASTVSHNRSFIFDFRMRLHHFNSVYKVELKAINEAFNWFYSSDFPEGTLYTDSLSAITALNPAFPTHELVMIILNKAIQNPYRLIQFG